MGTMNYKEVKKKYLETKRLLDIALDADRKDEVAHLVKSSITLEQLEIGKKFLKECEDMGIDRVARRAD